MLMSNMVIVFGFLLCCPFFLMLVEQGQAVVITDAMPSEYPYVVRFYLLIPIAHTEITTPGLVVSSKFVLTFVSTAVFGFSNFTMTDQFGVVRTPVKNGTILKGAATYFKVCRKFGGAKYSLRESDFNNLTTAVPDAQLIFFNKTSPVLRKMTIPVMNKTACATAKGVNPSTNSYICMDTSGFTDLCSIFIFNGTITMDYITGWSPLLAIGGQVQGLPSDKGCNDTTYWSSGNLAVLRQNLTAELPVVDIV
ncbi:uncharacterized protein LOC135947203 [Cloeon dipterum]|uniref:uncharacterized protein LOC135947203 n=1 Tax=Cloeon dipterum TaxID=197152 RepID=UPI00321FC5C3